MWHSLSGCLAVITCDLSTYSALLVNTSGRWRVRLIVGSAVKPLVSTFYINWSILCLFLLSSFDIMWLRLFVYIFRTNRKHLVSQRMRESIYLKYIDNWKMSMRGRRILNLNLSMCQNVFHLFRSWRTLQATAIMEEISLKRYFSSPHLCTGSRVQFVLLAPTDKN